MPDRQAAAGGDGLDTYGEHAASTGPKLLLTGCHLVAVAAAVWFLLGGPDALGLDEAVPLRRVLLVAAAVGYLGRLAVTTFVLQERRMPWAGAAVIGGWVLVIHATMAFLGGTNAAPVGVLTRLGVLLYLAGSVLNTGSELQRERFKHVPGHDGRLYTGGLFRLAVHVNYFGDLVLFTGFALIAGRPAALLVPAVMAGIFRFGTMPRLERHLAEHYGDDFRRYAHRTSRLVPYVY